MANSAVVSLNAGFDIGSENCYIAVTQGGGIEIILNDYSQRSTPAYVALGDRQRELGVSAKQKQPMNFKATFYALTRLVGRQFNDVISTEDVPFPIEAGEHGDVVISVKHNQQDYKFTAVQLLAMLITKLRQTSENVTDCVINCPGYFTDAQRRALLDAARLAGLQPLRILPDLTAVGLYFGFYQTHSVPAASIVAFVDCGHTTTQVAVMRFQTGATGIGSMTVLSAESDAFLGGANFNEVLAQHFISQSKLTTLSERGKLRLLEACDRVKKQMSANSNSLPVSVECLQDDRDYTWSIDRVKFEELAAPLFQRVEVMFRTALEKAHEKFLFLQKADEKTEFKIDSVEIVGGSSRVAALKRLAKQVFGLEPAAHLNADEAVARGCSLMCAMLSPTVKVKEFHVVDYAPYPISCKYWFEQEGDPKVYEIKELFSRGHPYPFTKKITASCSSLPMVVELEYRNEKGHVNGMCQFKISARENLTLHRNKLTILVRLDSSGLVSVTSASVAIENLSNGTTAENGNVAMEAEPAPPAPASAPVENSGSDESKMDVDQPPELAPAPVPEKPKFVNVHLAVEAVWVRGALTQDEQMLQREIEVSLVEADRDWKERADARNQLEEYVYEWKSRVNDSKEHANFRKNLEDMQNWLYEEEGLLSKRIYIEKLQDLDIECKILFPPPPPPPPAEPEPISPADPKAKEIPFETAADSGEPADVDVDDGQEA